MAHQRNSQVSQLAFLPYRDQDQPAHLVDTFDRDGDGWAACGVKVEFDRIFVVFFNPEISICSDCSVREKTCLHE